MKRLKLNDRANDMGAYLGKSCMPWRRVIPRSEKCAGLTILAVELVKNRETKMPFNVGADKVAAGL